MKNHHLQKSISSGQESSHDNLEKSLALLLLVICAELDVELIEKGWDLILLEVHDGIEDAENRVEDELVEGTLQGLSIMRSLVCPLLGVWVEVTVALHFSLERPGLHRAGPYTYPKTLHHLSSVNTELHGISLRELADSEGPSVKTRAESNGSLVWVDLDIAKRLVEVR